MTAIQSAYGDTEDALARATAASLQSEELRQAAESADRVLVIATTLYHAGLSDALALLRRAGSGAAHMQASQGELAQTRAAVALYKALGGGCTVASARQ